MFRFESSLLEMLKVENLRKKGQKLKILTKIDRWANSTISYVFDSVQFEYQKKIFKKNVLDVLRKNDFT